MIIIAFLYVNVKIQPLSREQGAGSREQGAGIKASENFVNVLFTCGL